MRRIRTIIRNRLSRFVRSEFKRAVTPQLVAFINSPQQSRQSFRDHTKNPLGNKLIYDELRNQLQNLGVLVEDVTIETADFDRWLKRFPRVKSHYGTKGWVEHCLEHYLAYHHLHITKGDLYIDVGALRSPFARLLGKEGVSAYRLDHTYPLGLHGRNIGADAGTIGLPDEFATVISSQDAFEMFAGDRDIRFLKEAMRILRPHGRCGIVPLYIDTTAFNAVSPYADLAGIPLDSELVWRDDEEDSVFTRHYSPQSFKQRVCDTLTSSATARVLYFRNLDEVIRRYGEPVYCFFMLICEKR